jgi:Deoxyribonuclease II
MRRSIVAVALMSLSLAPLEAVGQPAPLVSEGNPVDWLFVYKLNTKSFPECPARAVRACPFGGHPVAYKSGFGQQYVAASNAGGAYAHLKSGDGCLGDSGIDPIGATFAQIYTGSLNYVVWNDQFYNDPRIQGCGTSCASPWGHSKGVLAWDDSGNGVVIQGTTPSWPGSGNAEHARTDGNSLGCVTDDNVLVAQDFFALKLAPADVEKVAQALANASVVTNPDDPQIVKNGGPDSIQKLVAQLGSKSKSKRVTFDRLSTNVLLISKPAQVHAPPWLLVSSVLGSVDLLVASWWNHSDIPDTSAGQQIDCWPDSAGWTAAGAVVNAQTGHWQNTSFSLLGVGNPSGNHAKVGVTTSGDHPYAIFGDMNQEGALSGSCGVKQNGRGGMFFVVEDQDLHDEVQSLISDEPEAATGSRHSSTKRKAP